MIEGGRASSYHSITRAQGAPSTSESSAHQHLHLFFWSPSMRFPHRPHVPRPHLPRTHHYRPPHVHRSPPHRPFRGHGPSGGGPSGPLGWIVAIIILGIGAAIFFGTFRKGNNGFGGGFGKKDADLSPPQAVAAQPWSATEGGLTLTVDRVEGQGGGRFRIWMTATNNGSDKLTLPLFGYFKAVDNLGNDRSGTHASDNDAFAARLSDEPIRLEGVPVEPDERARRAFATFLRRQRPGLMGRLRRLLAI